MARRDLRKTFYLNTSQAKRLGLNDGFMSISWGIEVYYIGTGYPCGIHVMKNGSRTQLEVGVDEAINAVSGLWNKLTKAELKSCDQNPITRRMK